MLWPREAPAQLTMDPVGSHADGEHDDAADAKQSHEAQTLGGGHLQPVERRHR